MNLQKQILCIVRVSDDSNALTGAMSARLAPGPAPADYGRAPRIVHLRTAQHSCVTIYQTTQNDSGMIVKAPAKAVA